MPVVYGYTSLKCTTVS